MQAFPGSFGHGLIRLRASLRKEALTSFTLMAGISMKMQRRISRDGNGNFPIVPWYCSTIHA